jgi:hypothetical protein
LIHSLKINPHPPKLSLDANGRIGILFKAPEPKGSGAFSMVPPVPKLIAALVLSKPHPPMSCPSFPYTGPVRL